MGYLKEGFEIDYLPICKGEKCGDAILLRYGDLLSGDPSKQTIILIDGGFPDTGNEIINHLDKYYNNKRNINFVISTHPDEDHSAGLSVVLQYCHVNYLLMHKPWDHAKDIKDFFKSKNITVSGLEDRIEKSLQNVSDLEDIAIKKNITIIEPFEMLNFLPETLHILGPSKEYYENLLLNFKATPTPKEAYESPLYSALLNKFSKTVDDNYLKDLLNDDNDTNTPENKTSTIILIIINGEKFLFTGDAGKESLFNAIRFANNSGISLTDLNFLDVPHHGSKRNLCSSILKYIKSDTAFISAPKDDTDHPSKKVTNALIKKNIKAYINREKIICHAKDNIPRPGWIPLKEEPFYPKVEE